MCTLYIEYTRHAYKRLVVVVELKEWTLVVVGLSDNAGVAVAGVVKVVIPDGRQIE